MAHPASVLASPIQPLVRSVFYCPILPGQLEQSGGACFFLREAGDQPDCFNFLFAAFELPDALQAGQLRHKREAHLLWRDTGDFDSPPLDAPVPLVNLQKLRGKNLPGGSVLPGPKLQTGCL